MHINPDFRFSKGTAPGTTFQLKETERIFGCCFLLKTQAHIFLCTANTECLAGNTSVYMPVTKCSLSVLHEPSKKTKQAFVMCSTQQLTPPDCSHPKSFAVPVSKEAPKNCRAEHPVETPPRLSCLLFQQELHVKMPLAAAVVEEVPVIQSIDPDYGPSATLIPNKICEILIFKKQILLLCMQGFKYPFLSQLKGQ